MSAVLVGITRISLSIEQPEELPPTVLLKLKLLEVALGLTPLIHSVGNPKHSHLISRNIYIIS